jgi:hypothetical protein
MHTILKNYNNVIPSLGCFEGGGRRSIEISDTVSLQLSIILACHDNEKLNSVSHRYLYFSTYYF